LSEPASDRPAFLWLCHEAPRIVEEYDVDLVVYFFVSSADDLERNLAIYARRPLSNEGLPEMEMDPEYLLRPWEQKIPKGLPGEFYRYAMAKGLIQPGSKTELSFADPLRFLEDPRARGYMGSLSAVPLRTFQEKIKDIGDRQGRRIGFCSCFLPVRDCEPSAFHMDNLELIRSFWRGVAKRGKVPFLDLTPSFTALERTYWPLDEATANRHFDGNGHWFFAYILEHALIDQGLVPYETSIHRKKGTAKTLSP
jgi:hypothetical protein